MVKFETIEDVEDWLTPMNYEEFWRAIRPHCLIIHTREDCDAQITAGVATLEDVLFGMKAFAQHQLVKRHKLQRKPIGPVLRVVASHDG